MVSTCERLLRFSPTDIYALTNFESISRCPPILDLGLRTPFATTRIIPLFEVKIVKILSASPKSKDLRTIASV